MAEWLKEHLNGRHVECVGHARDRYGRLLAVCYLGGEDLNVGRSRMFPEMKFGALERYRVRGADGTPSLADVDPSDATALPFSKEELERATAADVAEIDRLQDVLYAQAKHALLVVLQGTDTSGKDGTIRKVFGPIDPLGVVATSFQKPTKRELAHDFLWRIHKAVPAAGTIGVFNRSHYEDVLVARVHDLIPRDRIEERYGQINAFERHLAENDVTLKFYLHISKKEQKARLQARLDDPNKRWKFDPGDLAERKHWDDYVTAYRIALERCSTEWAPGSSSRRTLLFQIVDRKPARKSSLGNGSKKRVVVSREGQSVGR